MAFLGSVYYDSVADGTDAPVNGTDPGYTGTAFDGDWINASMSIKVDDGDDNGGLHDYGTFDQRTKQITFFSSGGTGALSHDISPAETIVSHLIPYRCNSVPSSAVLILEYRSGGSVAAQVQHMSSGVLRVRAQYTAQGQGTHTLAINTDYWIRVKVRGHVSAGYIELELYDSDKNLIETIGDQVANNAQIGSIDEVRYGIQTASAGFSWSMGQLWWDDADYPAMPAAEAGGGDPPDPPSGFILELGTHVDMSGYSDSQDWNGMQDGTFWNSGEDGTGPLLWRRSFTSNAVSSWSSGPGSPDVSLGVTRSWVSFKGDTPYDTNADMQGFIDGDYDARMVSFINSVPTGQQVIFTIHHEPENDSGINASTWRDGQKYIHRFITDNKGSKDIKVAINLMGYTFDASSLRTVSDWCPVYLAADTKPTGFSTGDPAYDIFSLNFYDFDTSGDFKKHWDPTPGGNPDGMTGHLDDWVTAVNYWKGVAGVAQDYVRADLVWAIGEMSTQKTGSGSADWFEDMVFGGRDSGTLECVAYCCFQNTGWPEWYITGEIQDWIRANGNTFGSAATSGTVQGGGSLGPAVFSKTEGGGAGTITLVNSSVNTESEVTTFDITVPSWGQQNGDLWLLMVSKDDDSVFQILLDSQLTSLQEMVKTSTRGSRHEIGYRVHNGSEDATWTIDMQDTETAKWILMLWRNVDNDDPFDSVSVDYQTYANQSGNPAIGATLAAPNTADNMLINFTGGNDSTNIDLTEPGSMTLIQGSASTAISIPYIYMAYEQLSGTSAPGVRNWTDAGYYGDGVNGAFYLKEGTPNETTLTSSDGSILAGGSIGTALFTPAATASASSTITGGGSLGPAVVESSEVAGEFDPPTSYGAFLPPTSSRTGGLFRRDEDDPWSLWRWYTDVYTYGWTVAIISGVVTPTFANGPITLTADQLAAADTGSGVEGKAIFRGGQSFNITQAELDLLTSAGYGDYIT